MRILILQVAFSCALLGGNLSEILALAQSAELRNLRDFSKKPQEGAQGSRLNFEIDARYTFIPKEQGGYVTKTGGVTAKIEYLLFDGGASEAASEILLRENSEQVYKNEEFKNLTSLLIGRIYFNAVAVNSLINLEKARAEILENLLFDAQFWLEFKEIDASEFEGLSAALNAAKSELEELGLKQTELKSRINLLSNGELDFIDGSTLETPDFSREATNAALYAKEHALGAKQSANDKQAGKIMPKIYLKDTQYLDNDSFKTSDKTTSEVINKYAANNKPMIEFKWNLPDSLTTSREEQKARIEKQKAALDLNDAKNALMAKLGALEASIKELNARLQIVELKRKDTQPVFQNLARIYARGDKKYGEFLFLLNKEFQNELNFILDRDEAEIKKLEYYFESGEDIAKRIKE